MSSLKEAEDKLEEFLKDNPDLREYQNKVNRILRHCKAPKDKFRVLMGMLLENLENIQELTKGIRDGSKINKDK